MSKYTDQLCAVELIRHIANDYVELSHDKIVTQRDYHIKICKEWLNNYYTNLEKAYEENSNKNR